MPAVKGRKKPAPKRKKSTRGRGRKAPARPILDAVMRVWTGILTYTAVGLTTLTLIVVAMLFAGGYFWNLGDRIEDVTGRIARSLGFEVSRVTVRGGSEIADAEIMEALWTDEDGPILGQSLFHVDGQGARSRLETLGWIEAAAVQKLWPNTVHVTVVQRVPQALWQDDEGLFHLIDREGRLLKQVAGTERVDLPVVVGTADPREAQEMLSALAARPDLLARTAVVMSVNGRRYDLRFRNDFTAKLPEDDVAGALDRLDGLGAGTGRLAKTLDYIDLRDPKWAYFRPKES